MNNLKNIREQIDKIDDQILALIEKRYSLSKTVSKIKSQHNSPIYYEEREQNIFKRLSNKSFLKEDIKTIFNEIISLCRKNQKILNITYLKEHKTTSKIAINKIFGHFVTHSQIDALTDLDNSQHFFIIPLDDKTQIPIAKFLYKTDNYTGCIFYKIISLSKQFLLLSNDIEIKNFDQWLFFSDSSILYKKKDLELIDNTTTPYKKIKTYYGEY